MALKSKVFHMTNQRSLFAALIVFTTSAAQADEWTRFRGPNGSGVATSAHKLPDKIGPETNLLWRTSLPPGISSPVIANGRVFLTTVKGRKLSTVALNVKDGTLLWQKLAPILHRVKGKRLATASPVTDGELVVSFFGAAGLLCYDKGGNLKWKKDLGQLDNRFNHAASPILIGNRVILVVDHDGVSFVVAFDKQTGKELWRSYRYVLGRNYASPVVWKIGDQNYLVVTGSGLVTGYEIETGVAKWLIRSTCAVVNPTPVVGENGWLFVHGSSPPSGAKSTPFEQVLKAHDKNADSELQSAELPRSFLRAFFKRFDQNANGGISEKEYKSYEQLSRPFIKGMVAIKPGEGKDSLTLSHAWTQSRGMPRTPSAIAHKGVLYVVSEKGIFQSVDARSGKVIHKGRIGARGTVYSSPSMGDGKIYIGTNIW